MDLTEPITSLPGVGPKTEISFERLGIKTIRDLLWYAPFRYIDASSSTPINRLARDQEAVITAEIIGVKEKATARRRMKIIEAECQDETGTIKIVWFNQTYIKNLLVVGQTRIFYGKVGFDWQTKKIVLTNPLILNSLQILPVYHETSGLTSGFIRKIIKPILAQVDQLSDPLPESVLGQFRLESRSQAIKGIHFPINQSQIISSRRRLGFEELLFLGLQIRLLSKENRGASKAFPIPVDEVKRFVDMLPFQLTGSQRKTAWEILNNLNSSIPMKRLLMGDVGSGKTVVGAIASIAIAKLGSQTLWLAPTDVLANQHFNTLNELFKKMSYSVGLFTSNKKQADLFKNDIIVGTHALLEPTCQFRDVGLIIIDEQHRFGVKQRGRLKEMNSNNPHFLSMTATPIPRTLALTIYGDLDISVLTELPKNRLPILTEIVTSLNRSEMYHKISKEVSAGHQAFIITPLIEEANSGQLFSTKKSVLSEFKRLQEQVFPNLKLAFLHGKMKAKEKDQIMADFKDNKINILVATSIIEVGIDIPNATIMVIENADSFGLAQLHQFRGRVGRGLDRSYCFLSVENLSDKGRNRLEAMTKYNSGFELAEIDLQLRGPGSLSGLAQSGLPDLRLASLTDTLAIREAQLAEDMILKNDITPKLLEELKALAQTSHFE